MENEPVKIENPDSKYWKYRWTIKHFSKLKSQHHYSDRFLVGPHTCRLLIYPQREKSFFSIHLDIDPPNDLSVEFKVAVVDQINSKYTVVKASKCQITERGYIVNGTVIVEADIYINGVTESLTQNSEKVGSDKSAEIEQEVVAPTEVIAPIVLSDNMMRVEQQVEAHADIVLTSANKDQLSVQVISKSSSEAVKPTEALDVGGQVKIGASLEEKSPETQTDPDEQASNTGRLCEYPTAGQLFEEGQHCQSFVDDKFEDIGGFNVLKSQAPLYKQIWMKHGHIATSEVLISSYYGQVAVVSDIMICITEMHPSGSSELSSKMIDSWEKKLKMAEKLEFNIVWLREHFDRVKSDFYLEEEKLKVARVEKDQANMRLIRAKEKLVLANEEVRSARVKLAVVRSRIDSILYCRKWDEISRRLSFDKFP